MKHRIVFGDTETTGVSSTDRILQNAAAVFDVDFENKTMELVEYFEEEVVPPVPIDPVAASVHGIWYPDLKKAKPWSESKSAEKMQEYIDKGYVYCAHNSDFDTAMLEKEGIVFAPEKVIDTLAIARKVNAYNDDIKNNQLQYMRYYYDFDQQKDFKSFVYGNFKIRKLRPHTALSDIAVLAYYFLFLMREGHVTSLEQAIEMRRVPTLIDRVSFGNVFEKGTPISEAAVSTYEQYGRRKKGVEYLNWAISNMENLSADVRISLAHFVIEAAKARKLHITDPALTPFKFIAAAFLPEHKDFLEANGFDTVTAAQKTIQKISAKITEIEEKELVDESREYPTLKKLIEYYEYAQSKN